MESVQPDPFSPANNNSHRVDGLQVLLSSWDETIKPGSFRNSRPFPPPWWRAKMHRGREPLSIKNPDGIVSRRRRYDAVTRVCLIGAFTSPTGNWRRAGGEAGGLTCVKQGTIRGRVFNSHLGFYGGSGKNASNEWSADFFFLLIRVKIPGILRQDEHPILDVPV